MITGIILASGFSRRMGSNKMLLEVDGKPMIEQIILELKKTNLDKIVIIYREKIIREIAEKLDIDYIYNSKAKNGKSESIKLAIRYIQKGSLMFFTGDQPYINYKFINKMIDRHKNSMKKVITAPVYKNVIYMPTIFSECYRKELLKLKKDQGGKKVLKENMEYVQLVEVENREFVVDIDDEYDYNKWKNFKF